MTFQRTASIIDLHLSYGELKVLEGVNLELKSSEIMGVLGVSGSGKSTLLRAIGCLLKWSKGSFFVSREDYSSHTTRGKGAPGGAIQMVYQDTNLFQNMRVLRNLTIGLEKVRFIERERAEHLAHKMCADLGIDHLLGRYPDQISGGEAQRVALARAMLMEPEILLLDEVTASLDPVSAAVTIEALERLRGRMETPPITILATHAARFANRFCDNLVFLHDGVIRTEIEKGRLFDAREDRIVQDYVDALAHV